MNAHPAAPSIGPTSNSLSRTSREESPHNGHWPLLRRTFACIAIGFCTSLSAVAQSGSFTTIYEDATGYLTDLATDANGTIFGVCTKALNGVSTAVISVSPDGGATWTDSFDSQGPDYYTVVATGRRMVPPAIPGDAGTHEDSIIVAGNMADRWKVMRSTDAGESWQVIDEYRDQYWSAQRPGLPEILAAAVDTEGNAYIAAAAMIPIATRKGTSLQWGWLVRRIGRDGTTATFRFPEIAGGAVSVPYAITCVGTTVYVAGNGEDRSQVRRSDNGGASWTLVDNYRYDENRRSIAVGIAADNNGTIYVVGGAWHAPRKGNTLVTVSWLVRKGTGVAGSFTTDTRVVNASGWNEAISAAVDSTGNVHVTGQSLVTVNGIQTWHWLTKRLDAVSQTWATTDGQEGGPRRIATDPLGNIYWGGSSPLNGWLIRKSPAPVPFAEAAP